MVTIVSSGSLSYAGLYDSILADVYAITKRSDLVAETFKAIRKATMKFHMADDWDDDLKLVHPTIDTALVAGADYSYRYAIDLTDAFTFPGLRRVARIKQYNPTGATGKEVEFEEIAAENILDDYNLEKLNVWYQAGKQVNLRTTVQLAGVSVYYWKYPTVTVAAYDSWIAYQFPDAIIEEACGDIFNMIGKDFERNVYLGKFQENLQLIRQAQIK